VTYVCFIETARSGVPHMEPVEAGTVEEAVKAAVVLMRNHGDVIGGWIERDGKIVATIGPGMPPPNRITERLA
jgi:hypothetical protein